MGFPDFDIPVPPPPTPPASCGTNMLANGLATLTAQLTANAGSPIYITRDGVSVGACAVYGKKLLRLEDIEGGLRLEWTDMDFCIEAISYDFGDGRVLPRRGDVITAFFDDETADFKVFPYDSGDSCWRWADPMGHTMLRVHTKMVGSERIA
jgi:hypothetical protein